MKKFLITVVILATSCMGEEIQRDPCIDKIRVARFELSHIKARVATFDERLREVENDLKLIVALSPEGARPAVITEIQKSLKKIRYYTALNHDMIKSMERLRKIFEEKIQ